MLEKGAHIPLAIDVRGLTKRFGQRVAIDGLSMQVRFGQIFGLAGANGGGKSTSLRVLAGLLPLDGGMASVLGYILPREMVRAREAVGYLPQRNWLYSTLSVRENLRFRASVFGLKRPARSTDLQIEAFGLDAFANVPVRNLSGGWTRLVELAAVLIHRPRVLLLDEPTAGLDPSARQDIWRRLTSLAAQGTAIVLSTHDLAEAQRCSHLLLLSEGQVKAQGAPQDIPNQLEAAALIVRGRSALVAMEALPPWLLMAAYPHGSQLRVVVDSSKLGEIEDRLRSLGCLPHRVRLTLEDAVLAVAHRAGLTR
jgi:ABC-2 type transport system ATP-binding protein